VRKRRSRALIVGLILIAVFGSRFASAANAETHAGAIHWQPWSDDVFVQAQREHHIVLLDLEAVWCHWCHVMDEQTYRDPAVIKLLGEHYIALKVDQDSRPDLSNRYDDYGWPATIVFAPDGTELVKRSGFIPPLGMAAMLQAVVDDPTPGPSIQQAETPVFSASALSDEQRAALKQQYAQQYDSEHGGWGFVHKYLDRDSAEYALLLSQQGDDSAAQQLRQTLAAQRRLIDPVWGGAYQYSAGGDWNQPHFEKIMATQTTNLRLYSMAALQEQQSVERKDDLASAQAIYRYLTQFLSADDGAFYTSQDADLIAGEHAADYFALDDAARRKLGVPKIDTHRYARENGWAIEALVAFHAADPQAGALDRAIRAANWVIAHRSVVGGGFRHDERDSQLYLGDTLAMGRAFLALYSATADRLWLQRSMQAARFIDDHFAAGAAGYVTAKTARASVAGYAPQPLRSENSDLARYANLLFHYSGDARDRLMASRALRYLIAEPVASRFPAASALLTDAELSAPPLHITIVGAKNDASARALFDVAAQSPVGYKRVEWWDRTEAALPNADVAYPKLGRAAAFLCTAQSCSTPLFDAAAFQKKLLGSAAPVRGTSVLR
jgi:uncharacterized protein YyaL (SSP411 family)